MIIALCFITSLTIIMVSIKNVCHSRLDTYYANCYAQIKANKSTVNDNERIEDISVQSTHFHKIVCEVFSKQHLSVPTV